MLKVSSLSFGPVSSGRICPSHSFPSLMEPDTDVGAYRIGLRPVAAPNVLKRFMGSLRYEMRIVRVVFEPMLVRLTRVLVNWGSCRGNLFQGSVT